MGIIKSTIEMLHEQIEFLKEDIREKNLLIKILNYRNANDEDKINIDLVDEREFLSAVETTSMTTTNISSNENTDTDNYNSRDDNNNTNSIHRNLVDYDESLEGDLTKTINST